MRTLAGVQRQGGGIEGKVNFLVQRSHLAFEIALLAGCKTHKTVWKKKKKRIAYFPTLSAPEILQFAF